MPYNIFLILILNSFLEVVPQPGVKNVVVYASAP